MTPALKNRLADLDAQLIELAKPINVLKGLNWPDAIEEAFLAGWKDADADIPLYAEAKAEHRELRDRLGSSSLNAR